MEIICTKFEFASMLEACKENRCGAGGCGDCVLGSAFGDTDIPCGEQLVNVCKIVSAEVD